MNRYERGWWSWRGRSRGSGIDGCMYCCDEVKRHSVCLFASTAFAGNAPAPQQVVVTNTPRSTCTDGRPR